MKNGDWTLRRSFIHLNEIITGSYIWTKLYSRRKLSEVLNTQPNDSHFVYLRLNYNSQLKPSSLPYLKRKEQSIIKSLTSLSTLQSLLNMLLILDKEINFKEWLYSQTTSLCIRLRMYRKSLRSILSRAYSTYHISPISTLVSPVSPRSRTITNVRNLNVL